jgi:hypothetical protein
MKSCNSLPTLALVPPITLTSWVSPLRARFRAWGRGWRCCSSLQGTTLPRRRALPATPPNPPSGAFNCGFKDDFRLGLISGWPVERESTFETRPLCVVGCKPPPGNPHDYRVYRVSRLDWARQRKERNSGGWRGEIGTFRRSSKFAPPEKPRHYWPCAGVKKPGACPG